MLLKKVAVEYILEYGQRVSDEREREHPTHAPPFDSDRQRIQRIVLATPRSEAVGEAEKVSFADGIQHLDDGALDDLVFQRWDTLRIMHLPSIFGVGDRLRSIPASLRVVQSLARFFV